MLHQPDRALRGADGRVKRRGPAWVGRQLKARRRRQRGKVAGGKHAQHADHHRKEGESLDQGGADDHGGEDSAAGLGLPGDCFAGPSADGADADPTANASQPGADPGADQGQAVVWPGDLRADVVACASRNIHLGPCRNCHGQNDHRRDRGHADSHHDECSSNAQSVSGRAGPGSRGKPERRSVSCLPHLNPSRPASRGTSPAAPSQRRGVLTCLLVSRPCECRPA